MAWLYYLIEANMYLCVFYAFYHFVLKQETLYTLNRWYLLVICVLSFLLPLLTVTYTSSEGLSTPAQSNAIVYDLRPSATVASLPVLHQPLSAPSIFAVENIFPLFYLAVMVLFFASAFKEILKLMSLYQHSHKYKAGGVVYIELDSKREEVFSFFNWLFLHPRMRKNEIIIAHELIHIKQGHSYDVLFLEVIRCINWFNPLIYLLFKDAKLNHEYISDRSTAAQMRTKYDYANLLIEHAYLPNEQLTHSAFAQTQLEQRIKHLGKKGTRKTSVLKYIGFLPLLLILFFVAAFKVEKSYGWINLNVNADNISKADPSLTRSKTANSSFNIANQALSRVLPSSSGESKPIKRASTPPISGHQLSELVSGPTTMSKIAAAFAKKGEKLYAVDYELYWSLNPKNAEIRKVIHSLCLGTEAQLFRGKQADTLYIDRGFYTIDDGVLTVKTDNLWISAMDYPSDPDKELIVIDAYQQKLIDKLDRVDIRTSGLIHTVVLNPYFGYGKDGLVDSVPTKYVDVKKRDAHRRYVSNVSNVYIREASVTAKGIITNETRISKEDLRQPGIIW